MNPEESNQPPTAGEERNAGSDFSRGESGGQPGGPGFSSPQIAEPIQAERLAAAEVRASPAPQSQIPEDLRSPWGWSDLFLLVVIFFLGGLIITSLVEMTFAVLGVPVSNIQKDPKLLGTIELISQTILSLFVLAYLGAQVRIRFRQPFWRTLGWRRIKTRIIPGWMAGLGLVMTGFLTSVLVTFASSAIGSKGPLPIQSFYQDRLTAELLMAISVLIAPLFEETIFRGYLYPVLARSWGVAAGVVVTGVIFGLLHAPQLWHGWAQIGLLVCVGILFTYVRAASRTVLASYLLHVSYNAFIFLAFFVSSHGFRNLPHPQ